MIGRVDYRLREGESRREQMIGHKDATTTAIDALQPPHIYHLLDNAPDPHTIETHNDHYDVFVR